MATEINISNQDNLNATILRQGMTVANLTLSGVNSFSGAIRKILDSLGRTSGLITIILRNTTQGWTRRHAVSLRNVQTISESTVTGLQLSLF